MGGIGELMMSERGVHTSLNTFVKTRADFRLLLLCFLII